MSRDHWEHFRFGVDGGVATLTFTRPEKLNALTFEAYADLRDLLAESYRAWSEGRQPAWAGR